jgi:hypothetical protein
MMARRCDLPSAAGVNVECGWHADSRRCRKPVDKFVNQIRHVVEGSIARLKNWKILEHPFLGPLGKHPEITRAVVSLENYRTSLRIIFR